MNHRESQAREELTDQIIMTVAKYLDVDPMELPVLFEHVDIDELNRLFHPIEGNRRRGRVTFRYAGLDVVVTATAYNKRYVSIRDPSNASTSITQSAGAD